LYYYRNRYYHPALGRFLQQDPMGYEDSMNLYQAFGMNPVNFVDPMGEEISGNTIKYWGSYEKALKYVKYNYGLYLSGGNSADTAYKKLVSNGLVIDSGSVNDRMFALKLAMSPSFDVFDVTPAQFGKDLAGGLINAATSMASFAAKGLPGGSNPFVWAQIDYAQSWVQNKVNSTIGANEGSLGYWIGETYAPAVAGGILAAELECANATAQTENILPVKNLKSFVDVKYKTPSTVDELIEMMNKRPGVKAEYATGEELDYLRSVEVEGSHWMTEAKESSILIRKEVATRHTAFHEWLHRVLQKANGGNYRPGEDQIIEAFLERFKNLFKL
jgi:hypothetical protein